MVLIYNNIKSGIVGSVPPIVGSAIEIVGLSLRKWGCAERPIPSPMSALRLQCRAMLSPLYLLSVNRTI